MKQLNLLQRRKGTSELETNLRSKIDTFTKEIGEIRDEGRLEQIRNEQQQTKNELESIIERQLNGLILRSKANIIENNERNIKYFASLEKKRSETNRISRLLINNDIKTDQKQF